MSAPVLSWLFHALRKVKRHSAIRKKTDGWNPQQKPQSPPIRYSIVLQTLRLNPQSQSLSRGYGSILPTSLIYIVLLTRGCTPWRPEAVMSTSKAHQTVQNILLYQSFNLIAGQSDSKVHQTVKKKRKLFLGHSPASPISFVLPLNIHFLVREY